VNPAYTLSLVLYLCITALIASILAIRSRDLVKAVAFSAMQSVAYAIIYALLLAPDILFVYVAVGVGIYPVLMLYAISKTKRFEEVEEG